jgi:hypothetical protein
LKEWTGTGGQRIVVAIVQLCYAIVTLYRARGDQIAMYGIVGNFSAVSEKTFNMINSASLEEILIPVGFWPFLAETQPLWTFYFKLFFVTKDSLLGNVSAAWGCSGGTCYRIQYGDLLVECCCMFLLTRLFCPFQDSALAAFSSPLFSPLHLKYQKFSSAKTLKTPPNLHSALGYYTNSTMRYPRAVILFRYPLEILYCGLP